MCQLKNIFFSCMYKMSKISKEAYKKCEIETIVDEQYSWVNMRDLEIESDLKNWVVIFDKCDPKKKQKHR